MFKGVLVVVVLPPVVPLNGGMPASELAMVGSDTATQQREGNTRE